MAKVSHIICPPIILTKRYIVFQQGDSGTWVIDASTNKVYGHVVASDAVGRAFVVPLYDIFADVTSGIFQSSLKVIQLPSRHQSWIFALSSTRSMFTNLGSNDSGYASNATSQNSNPSYSHWSPPKIEIEDDIETRFQKRGINVRKE